MPMKATHFPMSITNSTENTQITYAFFRFKSTLHTYFGWFMHMAIPSYTDDL